MANKKNSITSKLALSSLLALSAAGLTACMPTAKDTVKCTGLNTVDGKALYISKGLCKKIAGGKPKPVTCDNWQTHDGYYECKNPVLKVRDFPGSSYIKCYGVAQASMNDCGTKTTACGGTVHVSARKDAWIAIPKGVCIQLKGSRVAKPDNKK